MWDILDFSTEGMSLTLRNRDTMATFAYPWSSVTTTDEPRIEGGAQAINVKEGDLFKELAIRVRYDAFCVIARMARNGMNGKTPTNHDQMHDEALKFALRRYQKGLIKALFLVDVIKSSALLRVLPNGFWKNLQKLVTPQQYENIRTSVELLYIFHEKKQSQWIEDLIPYLSKVLWFKNDFDNIRTGGKLLAIFHRDHPLHHEINAIADKASSMIMKAEIEVDQASRKPWQRGSATITRGVRGVPAKGRRSPANDEEKEEKDRK